LSKQITIGQLARRVGLRTSTLRYYEEQGLVTPAGRTAAGYRLYTPGAERTLRFIQRAQRLGFSLADIHTLLQSSRPETVISLAEERFLALERRLTKLLVLRHELELLLNEFREKEADGPAESLFDRLLDRVCASPPENPPADSLLEWLADRADCVLAGSDAQALLAPLRGRHFHAWQKGDAYHILVVGHDPAVESALRQLAQLEAHCQVHPTPQLRAHKEGTLLVARGENAFIFARLFLALEQEKGHQAG